MSNLLTLGVYSQQASSFDLAAQMANEYCDYVISQGGEVDYLTIYNIYKDEYLTDPNYLKMAVWFDARAGKKRFISGNPDVFRESYSLIYPFITANSGSSAWRVENNKILKSGTTTPVLSFNMYCLFQNVRNLITVTKLDWLPSSGGATVPITYYFGKDINGTNGVSHYLRYYVATNAIPRSYLTHYDLLAPSTITTHTAIATDLIGVVNTKEINYVDMVHRNTFNGEMKQSLIYAPRTHKIIEPSTVATMYVYDHCPRYFEKVYLM